MNARESLIRYLDLYLEGRISLEDLTEALEELEMDYTEKMKLKFQIGDLIAKAEMKEFLDK